MKRWVFSLLDTGVMDNLSREEIKNTRLLNAGCLAWIPLNVLFIFEDLILNPEPWINVSTFAITSVALFAILLFQRKTWHKTARGIFIGLSLLHYMAFCVFLEPGSLIEFFMLMIPIFTLIFFNNWWLGILSLIVSFACFTYTITYFNNYPGLEMQHLANLALFFAIYLAFAYFKNLNIKSEKSLEEQKNQAIEASRKIEEQRKELEIQRNQALEDGKKIEQQRKELEELNRFQAHFWVNLSHEIRTPLTLIKGASQKLLKESQEEDFKDYFQRIDKNADKIKLLIDNIMDLAKIKADKLVLHEVKTDLAALVSKTFSSFEPLFTEKKIDYSFENNTGYSGIICDLDPLFFERALTNLLLNAYKYTPKEGKINVKLQIESNTALIQIIDTGCGIPKDEIEHIFDSFYRAQNTQNEAGGTGVGLSFTKEIIQLHKGDIHVESIEGFGATFTVKIPYSGLLKNNGPTVEKSNLINTTQAKILIVEDNTDMRQYIMELLKDFSTHEADNGKSALEKVQQNTYELIITDYMMPELNGYQFINSIRNDGNDCPVIVLTARTDTEAKLEFLRLGIDDYLTKPFNEEELRIRVENCIKKFRSKNSYNNHGDLSNDFLLNDELEKIKRIVEANIKASDFNLQGLAEELFMTERTLNRKIKSWCGLTPNALIREIKMQKAYEYYLNRKVSSLKELAAEVGFKNTGHFSKLFQGRFGIKPNFDLPALKQTHE